MVPLFFSMLSQQLGSLKQPQTEPISVVEEEMKKPKEVEKPKDKIAEPVKDKKKILRGKPSTSKKPEPTVKISEPETKLESETKPESVEEKPVTIQDAKPEPDLPAEENGALNKPEVSEVKLQLDVAPELNVTTPEQVIEVEDEVVKETAVKSQSNPFSSPIFNMNDSQQLEPIKISSPNEKLDDYQGIKLESLPIKATNLDKPEVKTARSTAIDNFEWKFDDDDEIGSMLESRYKSSGRGEVVTF